MSFLYAPRRGYRDRRTCLALTSGLLVLSISTDSPRAQAPGRACFDAGSAASRPDRRRSPAPGSRCLGCGTAPEPVDYNDRTGWTQIFDGKTLNNWDGNPEVWKVEDGAIVAEHWPERRVGDHLHHLARRRAGRLRVEARGQGRLRRARRDFLSLHRRAGTRDAGRRRLGPRAAQVVARPRRRGRSRHRQPSRPIPKWNVRGYALDWDYDPGNNGNIQDPGAGRTRHTNRVARPHRPYGERQAPPLDRHASAIATR